MATCPGPQFLSRPRAAVQLLVHGVVFCNAHEMAGIFMPVGVTEDRAYMGCGLQKFGDKPWKILMGERSGPFSAVGLWRAGAGAGAGEMHSLTFSSSQEVDLNWHPGVMWLRTCVRTFGLGNGCLLFNKYAPLCCGHSLFTGTGILNMCALPAHSYPTEISFP